MMRKHFYKAAALLSAMTLVTACSDENGAWSDGSGRISPSVDLDVKAIISTASRASSDVTVNDLKLTLTKADGSYTHTWESVADFPLDQQFVVGEYTIEASYGDANEEGFEKPAYYGKQTITVKDGETTQVALSAKLANSMVDISYTDELKNYMNSWSANLHSDGGQYIYIAPDETRPAYIRPGNATVSVTVEKPNGQQATFDVASFAAEAQHYYHVTVGLNNGASDAVLTVTFEGVEGQETIEIELSDELMNAPAPVITPSGFTSGQSFVAIAGEDFIGDISMNIIAKGTLQSVTLTTQSRSLIAQGWPAEIDLMAATPAEKSTLEALGLSARGVFGVTDKMAVINLKDVVKHIALLSSGDNITTFTIVAKDKATKLSEPVSVSFDVQAISLSLAKIADIAPGAPTLDLELTYNGNDPESELTFQYKNERGSWSPITPVSITPANSRAGNKYIVTFNTPFSDRDNIIRAVRGSVVSAEVTVSNTNPNLTASVNPIDCFATSAVVNVASSDINVSANANLIKFFVSTDGTNFTKVNATASGTAFALNGLQAGKNYTVKVGVLDDVAEATGIATFATEAAAAIPNANLDTWCQEQPTTQYQIVYYPGSDKNGPWASLNELTTSTRGTGNSIVSYGGSSYRAFSGTRPTDDAHSGKAAIVETVGWGSKNTAAGTTVGKCENRTPGELFLGSYNNGALYGYAFTSRPASMTFWYKYTAKNSADYGLATIQVLDASGNVLAQASQQLNAAGSYQQVTLPLSYAKGAAKAASIRVNFKSSDNASCLEYNSDNWHVPAFGNYTDGRYYGSTLYIDDITLNY